MALLPAGTVTFLFADIEGSTRLLERLGKRYADLLADYHRLLRTAFHERGGKEVDTQGDGIFVAFPRAKDAVAAAVAAQRAIATYAWPGGTTVRVRMGLHTGEPLSAETGYVGMDVHRAARICAAGYGGQILLSRTTRELLEDDLPQDTALQDLGHHRLKDLARPQHLFQIAAVGLPADFPPLKTVDAVPNNLPIQLTSFIGREREMVDIKRLLDGARILTLTGAGGSGKTRLVLQVAADVLEEYPDGLWRVELAPLADASVVPHAVAITLGVREQPGRDAVETLVDHIGRKRLLLILDNAEHVLAPCAQVADSLLRRCPKLKILATSREGMGIAGEALYPVPPLSLPDPRQTLPVERIVQFEGIRLFVERAALVLPTFKVTERNAQAVIQICYRLDGLPLAIELAAARVKVLPAEQIASRLDDRFRLLAGGARTALPRHQTLRAAMDWSYELLSEHEQAVLRRLSVFAGGWSLEAAETVCAGQGVEAGDVFDLLSRLVDKSLVVVYEAREEGRYRLLETVRQFGRDRLVESGEAETIRKRHRDLFLALAEEAEPRLRTAEQAYWLNRLDTEHDNLRAALEWSQGVSDAESGVRLAGALARFWAMRGYMTEAHKRLEDFLALTQGNHTRARAKLLRAVGNITRQQGDLATARVHLEESVTLSRALGNRHGLAESLLALGSVHYRTGDYGAATALFKESLSISQTVGDDWGIGESLHLRGHVALDQGAHAQAHSLFEESVKTFRGTGNRYGLAHPLSDLGRMALQQGDYTSAHRIFEEDLAIFRELGSRTGIAMSLEDLGEVALAEGNYPLARARLKESLALHRDLGIKAAIASTLNALADAAVLQSDDVEAKLLLEEALALSQEAGSKKVIARSLRNLGRLVYRQGDHARAQALLKESLRLSKELGYKDGIMLCLQGVAEVLGAYGHLVRAARLFGAATLLRESIGAALYPRDQAELEQTVSAARAALGTEAFGVAWAEGQAMTLEQAVEYGLSALPT